MKTNAFIRPRCLISIFSMICTILLVGGAISLSPRVEAKAAQPAVTCNNTAGGCDQKDPQDSGCWKDSSGVLVAGAHIVDTQPIGDRGTLKLWYSTVCGTNWGEVVGKSESNCKDDKGNSVKMIVAIAQDKDKEEHPKLISTDFQAPSTNCTQHSIMLYLPTDPALVCGNIAGTFTNGDDGQQTAHCITQPFFYLGAPNTSGAAANYQCNPDCGGYDPITSGCWTDSSGKNVIGTSIVDARNLHEPTSDPVRSDVVVVGKLYLWYSNACGTNWGQIVLDPVVNNNGTIGTCPNIDESLLIMRPGQSMLSANLPQVQRKGCMAYTAMVHTPTTPIQLCGELNHMLPAKFYMWQQCLTQPGFYGLQ